MEQIRIKAQAKQLGLTIHDPMTYDQYLSRRPDPKTKNILIDNAEEILVSICHSRGSTIDTMTITQRNEFGEPMDPVEDPEPEPPQDDRFPPEKGAFDKLKKEGQNEQSRADQENNGGA